MNNLIGIIKSTEENRDYQSLLKTRPDYMLPFASRYRIVDFTLTNFSQHGLTKVILYAGEKLRSTLDHVGNGKSWGMDKRVNGLMINPLPYSSSTKRTEISVFFDSLKYYEESKQEDLYISNPMVVSRIDITKAYRIFKENDYDVMFLYRKQDDHSSYYLNTNKIIFDENGKIVNIGLNLGTEKVFNMYIENVFIKKEVFIKLVKESVEKSNANTIAQAVINNKDKLNIGTLELFRHVEYIRDLQTYYNANMNLLLSGVYYDILLASGGILTKSKDEPSTMYMAENQVRSSILANGCIIEGDVENSILFRGVKIGKNAIVKNSIIFQNAEIGDNAIIINSIVDKNVIIKNNVFVQGTQNNPYVVEKNKILEN